VRRTSRHLGVLTKIVERHAHQPDGEDCVADDHNFHVTPAEASQNSQRVWFVSELRELQSELSLTMSRTQGGLAAPVGEHAAIVESVRKQDEKAAAAEMLAHLEGIRDRLASDRQ